MMYISSILILLLFEPSPTSADYFHLITPLRSTGIIERAVPPYPNSTETYHGSPSGQPFRHASDEYQDVQSIGARYTDKPLPRPTGLTKRAPPLYPNTTVTYHGSATGFPLQGPSNEYQNEYQATENLESRNIDNNEPSNKKEAAGGGGHPAPAGGHGTGEGFSPKSGGSGGSSHESAAISLSEKSIIATALRSLALPSWFKIYVMPDAFRAAKPVIKSGAKQSGTSTSTDSRLSDFQSQMEGSVMYLSCYTQYGYAVCKNVYGQKLCYTDELQVDCSSIPRTSSANSLMRSNWGRSACDSADSSLRKCEREGWPWRRRRKAQG